MQILKTQEIELLRQNGAEFIDFILIPQTENPRLFSVEFTVKNGNNIERALLMSSRNKVRLFGDIQKAVIALFEVFPEMENIDSIKYQISVDK